MVKILLPRRANARAQADRYRCGNHTPVAEGACCSHRAPVSKILIEFDSVKFDENSRRIRVDFAQKPRFNANDSFKPVC